MPLALESNAFVEDGALPVQHTADGPDLSPPLKWRDPPDGTAAFALVVEDPDAPGGTFAHWLLWNVPASARTLPQEVTRARHLDDGSRQGRNDYGELGWGGPSPPPGRPHRYVFRLFALGSRLELGAGADRAAVLGALEGRVLEEVQTCARYGRPV